MHNPNQIIARLGETQSVASAVNGAATITLAAPGATMRWLVLSTSISMSGDPTATVSFTIKSTAGATLLEQLEFPAAACAPVVSNCIYKGDTNGDVVLNLPALGTAIRGTVSVRAVKVPANGV